jgi:Right handed beta helix region
MVLVGPGRYAELVTSARPGRPTAPIRIVGRPGAHLVGPEGIARGRLVQLLHDHVTVESLELSHANILVWVQGTRGVRVAGNRIHDAGGECVRLKDFARHNEVAGNAIARCGRVRFDLARGSKNGEGVYIGTAPEQAGGWPDRSDANLVHRNRIAPTAECVDVKEGASRNRVEHNRCAGSDDPDGAGFSSRGDRTTFRANISTRHAGAGIRLGGDRPTQGLHNAVVGNILADNAGYGLKVLRSPQGRIAANAFARNRRGRTNHRS